MPPLPGLIPVLNTWSDPGSGYYMQILAEEQVLLPVDLFSGEEAMARLARPEWVCRGWGVRI